MTSTSGSDPIDLQGLPGLPAAPHFTWMVPYGGGRYYLLDNLYRPEGSDSLDFFDPEAPGVYQPREGFEPVLSLPLNKRQAEQLRDALDERLKNWGGE